MINKKVVITGVGILSSIGDSVEAHLYALTHRRPCLTRVHNFETAHKYHIKVGEIKHTNNELSRTLHLPAVNAYSRTALLGIIAAQQAIANARLSPLHLASTGLVMASSVGGMDMTERYLYSYEDNEHSRRYINTHYIGSVSHQIADYFRLKGVVTSLSTACSSSANALITASHLIRTGRADCLIVGGADALCKFTINGLFVPSLPRVSVKNQFPFIPYF